MHLLCDKEIKLLVQEKNTISPFVPELVAGKDMISYGLTPSGYDIRIDSEYKLFHSSPNVIDPLQFDHSCYSCLEGDELIIPAGGFVLCSTIEYFALPDYISILCVGKSTYARCGIVVNPTVIEPGFHGTVVIELSNTNPCPVKIRAGNNGIAKFMFYKINGCENPYNSKTGRYQNQSGILVP